MIPRKANTLFPKIASDLDIPEELVSDVIDFYWKEAKKMLDESENINIRLESFGTFEIRKKQVEYLIKKYRRIIEYINPKTYNKHLMLDIARKKLDILERRLTLCKEQEEKKRKIRKTQKNG